jgi:hypothetical protein
MVRAVGAAGSVGEGALEVRPPTWLDRLTAGFTGRVVDELDRPLGGAIVVIFNARAVGAPVTPAAGTAGDRARRRRAPFVPADPAAGPVAFASTEADGRFALPVLPHGRYILVALHIGPPPAMSDALVLDGGYLTAPLRLVVARTSAALL